MLAKPSIEKGSSTGTVFGYDPGGDGKHGVAVLRIHAGTPVSIETDALKTAEAVIRYFRLHSDALAIGIDTLTCWSTGPSGWRPADRWLRKQYPAVVKSVVAPNSLFGSMGLNGPSVLTSLRTAVPSLLVTETHPKILHWHLTKDRYDFASQRTRMQALLVAQLNVPVETASEHAWDAALSALAAYKGLTSQWTTDLHRQPILTNEERVVWPCGPTHYFWPDM